MTDIYESLFGQRAPWAQPTGERRADQPNRSTQGLTIGGDVGNRIERTRPRRSADPGQQTQSEIVREQAGNFPFPMGPERAPPTADLAPEERDQYARAQRDVAEFGAEAAQLARQSRFGARLPVEDARSTDAANPATFMRGGTALTERAATAVGIPGRYLDHLITQESGGDPNARASTSTATGHAQFIESTWLQMMHDYAERYGQPEVSNAIEVKTNSRGERSYFVRDARMRADILGLRTDPTWAALMAGEHARENADKLRGNLRRDPTDGEVYLAHFAGPARAAAMISAALDDARSGQRRPGTAFVSEEAVRANRNVFYDERGRPRSVSEVVARQTAGFGRDQFISTQR